MAHNSNPVAFGLHNGGNPRPSPLLASLHGTAEEIAWARLTEVPAWQHVLERAQLISWAKPLLEQAVKDSMLGVSFLDQERDWD